MLVHVKLHAMLGHKAATLTSGPFGKPPSAPAVEIARTAPPTHGACARVALAADLNGPAHFTDRGARLVVNLRQTVHRNPLKHRGPLLAEWPSERVFSGAMTNVPDDRGISLLTQADNAELWTLWHELWDSYNAHLPCADCDAGDCHRTKEAVAVYSDYHLRLLRLRRAQTLRATENGNDRRPSR